MHFIMASLSIMALARAAQWTTMVIRVFDEVTAAAAVASRYRCSWLQLQFLSLVCLCTCSDEFQCPDASAYSKLQTEPATCISACCCILVVSLLSI